MSKHNQKKIEEVIEAETPVCIGEVIELLQEQGDTETVEDIVRPRSVVPAGYKAAYAARAMARGETSKAAKRQNGDWLAKELLAECVPDGKTFDMMRFLDILEANGVSDPLNRWPNRNKGWEGRLRMSGAIVLRGLVKKAGVLVTPDTTIEVPESFRK
jgi:hypothetical protein